MHEKKEVSQFRLWVHNLWLDSRDERSQLKILPLTMEQYWAKYKWWLKREYVHQHKKRKTKRKNES